MKKIYCFVLPLLLSGFALSSCDDEDQEVVKLQNQDPVVTVEGISPMSGYAGSEFTINGTEFGIMADAVKVTMGGTELEVVSCEENAIVVRVPEGATAGKITVEVYGQTVATEFIYDVLGEPGVTAVTPVYGFAGDEITFAGHDLGVSASFYTVMFSGSAEPALLASAPGSESFVVEVPEDAVSGPVALTISDREVNVPLTNGFTVLQHATVTGLSASEGYSGSEIIVNGTNLNPVLLEENVELDPIKVTFAQGGTVAEAVVDMEKTTDGTIVAELPEEMAEGTYTVTVSTSFETVVTETPLTYTVIPSPVAEGISVSQAHNGSEVTFTCKNLSGVTADDVEVLFGEVKAEVTSVDAEAGTVTVKVPILDAGEVTLSLRIKGKFIDLGENALFTVLATPKITSINTGNFLHNETAALVKEGDEIVIAGEGFGTEEEHVTLKFGETTVDIASISDTEIRAYVPAGGFGAVSLTFAGIETPVEAGLELKELTDGMEVTEYALKNYKANFISLAQDNSDLERQGEWSKPADWTVVNNSDSNMEGYGLQHNPKNDVNAGYALALQTDWGFPNSMTDGKIYQAVTLVAGKYRLEASVLEVAISGSAYLAVADDAGFGVTTDGISSALASAQITAPGTVGLEFATASAGQVSVGFVCTLTAKQKYVKINGFKLIYVGE